MRRADSAAIEAGTPTERLMDRAGRAVARAATRQARGRYGRRAAVVCGRGNNGGDGFVAARALAAEGLAVRCFFIGDLSSVKGPAQHHLGELAAEGVTVESFDRSALESADVVVDALFGTGFRGPAEGEAKEAIDAINDARAPVVAVDIPSGVDGATGAVQGPAVAAQVTVAMAAEKIGTAVGAGAALAGRVEVADIGIPVQEASAHMIERADVARALPRRAADAHKKSAGSVALLAGSDEMRGAALLSSRGAVRAGAGYATLGTTAGVKQGVMGAAPELLCRSVTAGDVLGPDAVEAFRDVLESADALAVGPGIGRGSDQEKLLEALLAETRAAMVIDADGLNVLANRTDLLRDCAAPVVLTPHPAELGRLLQLSVGEIQSDRLGAARRAARQLGCVVLLKGFRTVVAAPAGEAAVNPSGGPELATAGTGDVLTGALAALLAAGLPAFDAAWCGVYLHGVAGGVAARASESGVLAWDVAEALPEAVSRVREG